MTTPSIRTSRRAAISGAAGALGGPAALAQGATPATDEAIGLGVWAEQLATLDPAEIARMLVEREPSPHVYNTPLVAEDITAEMTGAEDAPFPVDRIVSVVGP